MSVNLFTVAGRCLHCTDVGGKLEIAHRLHEDWRHGRLRLDGEVPAAGPPVAGRPPLPVLVNPARLAQRRIGKPEGQAALIHAVAHIVQRDQPGL